MHIHATLWERAAQPRARARTAVVTILGVLLALPPTSASAQTAEPTVPVTIFGGTAALSDEVAQGLSELDGVASVQRVSGPNRYATAAAVSRARHEPGVDVVFVASGVDFPDGLSGAAAAAAARAPLLFTDPATLPAETAEELQRLAPRRVVVLGGVRAVSDAVATRIAELTGATISRLSGPNRYATAAAISASFVQPGTDVVYVARGDEFPDALAAAPAAARSATSVLLTDPEALPRATVEELRRIAPNRVVVVGGTQAVSERVLSKLGDYADEVERVAGADRYETALRLAVTFPYGPGAPLHLVSGESFADAMAAAAASTTPARESMAPDEGSMAPSAFEPDIRPLTQLLNPRVAGVLPQPGGPANPDMGGPVIDFLVGKPMFLSNNGTLEDTAIELVVTVQTNNAVIKLQGGPSNGTAEFVRDCSVFTTCRIIRYVPAADFYGKDRVTVVAGEERLQEATADITVTPVNDAPRYILIPSTHALPPGRPEVRLSAWMFHLFPGPNNEGGQRITSISISSYAPAAAFAVPPSIDPAGVLTYRMTMEQDAAFTVTVVDGGGTENGGINRKDTVVPVDVPDPSPGRGAVNAPPTVTTTGTPVEYTENDPGVAVDPDLVVTNPDDTTLTGATVSITGGFEEGDDLVFFNQNGITGNYAVGTGVLTLSGSATIEDYQTALRSVEYQSEDDDPADRVVTFTVSDAAASSTPATRTIDITAVNDAPVLTIDDEPVQHTEGMGNTAVADGATVEDPDSDELVGFTAQITGGYANGEDSLIATVSPDMEADFDPDTGMLSVTGTGTLPEWQDAVRSVQFVNDSASPAEDARTVSFELDDGGDENNLSLAETRTVNLTPVNSPPVVDTTDSSHVYEGRAVLDDGVTASDEDDITLEGGKVWFTQGFSNDTLHFTDTAAISGTYNALTGVLTLSGPASVADYQAALRSVEIELSVDEGTREVSFALDDGAGLGSSATREVARVD